MRRVMLLALLALALPVMAFANSGFDFTDSGSLNGTSNGYAHSGSALFGLRGISGGALNSENKLGSLRFLGNGFSSNEVSVRLTANPARAGLDGPAQISSGDTNVVVPEPGTLVLLGTGLVGIAGLLRRKARQR